METKGVLYQVLLSFTFLYRFYLKLNQFLNLAVTFILLFLGQIHLNVPDLLFGYTRESTITPTIDVYISLDANYPSGDVSHQVTFNHFEIVLIKISLHSSRQMKTLKWLKMQKI